LFGAKQHGLPPLRIANLISDAAILDEARAAAQHLVTADPNLDHPSHARIRAMMMTRYGQALEISDVG
ncbi:MAG: hypothetical protein AB7O62_25930, partial [Pirellulales bacterium]